MHILTLPSYYFLYARMYVVVAAASFYNLIIWKKYLKYANLNRSLRRERGVGGPAAPAAASGGGGGGD